MSFPKRSALLLSVLLAASAALADWTVDPATARVHFVSIKANRIAEVHAFRRVTGRASRDGSVTVEIFLTSVDTSIGVRDERMREMLFEVGDFPSAVISARLDPGIFDALGAGETTSFATPALLALHGREAQIELDMQLTGTADGGLLVTSVSPVVVDAADFALASGVDRLREVAGLPSISPAVPVTFSLHFRPD